MSAEVVLAARALRVERRARDASFTLEVEELALRAGEVLAVLGPNGAGKSTLLRALHDPNARATTPQRDRQRAELGPHLVKCRAHLLHVVRSKLAPAQQQSQKSKSKSIL